MHFREMIKARNAPYVTVPPLPLLADPRTLDIGFVHPDGTRVLATKRCRIDGGVNGREYAFTSPIHGDCFEFSTLLGPGQQVVSNDGYRPVFVFSAPSVTTILDKVIETPELDAWRDAVGHAFADRVAAESAEQGQLVHSLCEEYLLTGIVDLQGDLAKSATTDAMNLFHLIRQELSTLDAIHHVEQSLVSLRYGFAGTVDAICTRRGRKCILDVKTYRKKRTRPQLEKAFVQMALYALAAESNIEGFIAEDLVVVYSNPEHGLQVETALYSDYRQKAIDAATTYHHLFPMQPSNLESSSWH